MPHKSDFIELCFSVFIPLLVVIGIMCLIMAAPNLERIMGW